jgi:hypothetical protein
MNKAAEAIRDIAKQDDVKMIVCTVDSVDGSMCDVTPLNDCAPLKKVRLNADINSDLGIVITPKLNSVVLVGEISKADAFVAMFSEIENISIKIGSSSALIKDGEISFNGGNLGGLVKVQELTNKLNALETAMDTHIHSGGTANGMTGTATPPKFPVKTQKSQIENTKVKH